MARKFLAVLLVVLLAFPINAQAVMPRVISAAPSISYNGTTATCSATIIANSSTDTIQATLTLYHGTSITTRWTASGQGYLHTSRDVVVIRGWTYRLEVEYTVNGKQMTTAMVEKECP